MNGFLHPKGLLWAGGILILAGLALRYFSGMKGEMHLLTGETKTLVAGSHETTTQDTSRKTLGLTITLDSLRFGAYTPEFEILVWGPDTSRNAETEHGNLIQRYPSDTMTIRKIGETDYSFRLKAIYPNFQFAYEYPANRDTIRPRAPGITLQLKTREGTPIVTLGTTQPNKNKLDDIVSLGAPLFFSWETSEDSIKAMINVGGKMENKVVFSGADQRVYFILEDSLVMQPLKEGVFYKMPGQDTVGFTVLYSFPDYAYLKAVPSTVDDKMLNPVAHIEVWKTGEGYRDAFIYPEKRGRKGGVYAIPGSDHKLGLGENEAQALKHCDCFLNIRQEGEETSQVLGLRSGKSATHMGYRFTPIACQDGIERSASIRIDKNPGKILIIMGFALVMLSLGYWFFQKKA